VSPSSSRGIRRALIAAAVLLAPAAATAQQTRTDAHAQAQAVRAADVTPPTRGPFERAIQQIKRVGVFSRTPSGLHPVVTTVYPGGWMAAGAGYRTHVGDRGTIDVVGAWSVKNFRKVEAGLELPDWLGSPVSLEVAGSWIDAPAVAFYGVGGDSRTEDRGTFAYRPRTVGLTATVPWKALAVGGGIDYLAVDIGSTFDAPAEALDGVPLPGLGDRARYLRTRGLAQMDWRRTPGYTGSGGLYRVEVQDYADRAGANGGFRSAEAEVIQLIPILRANWVLAFRGLATVTDSHQGDRLPFYLMPSLGGNSSVRGYPSLRFRGHHRLLLTGEYRWTATRFMDMALFYDAGKVATDVDQLDLRDLKHAYGIGARFHGTKRTVFRLEVARNDAGGWRMIWATGAPF
jgi:hypothetical protein